MTTAELKSKADLAWAARDAAYARRARIVQKAKAERDLVKRRNLWNKAEMAMGDILKCADAANHYATLLERRGE